MRLYIDPGVKAGCACAMFDGPLLYRVWFTTDDVLPTWLKRVILFVAVERPEYHGCRSQNASAISLIDLAWEGAKWAYYYGVSANCQVVEWTPTEWKGTEGKPTMHMRAWNALTHVEQSLLGGHDTYLAIGKACQKYANGTRPGDKCYPAKFKMHNILDAVCMGLAHAGRLKTKGRKKL